MMGIVSRLGEHLKLFDGMMDRTGVNDVAWNAPDAGRELRNAVLRCAACSETAACKDWLDEAAEGAPAPDFCRNAHLLQRLTAMEAVD